MSLRMAFSARVLLAVFASQLLGIAQAPPRVEEFYQELVNHPPSGMVPLDKTTQVADQIPALSSREVSRALPSIVATLTHSDLTVKLAAAPALIAIDSRFDSAELLTPYLGTICDLLNQPDSRVADMALMALAYLKPAPPPEVIPRLLAFVRRADANTDRQARAVWVLLKQAPDKPEVLTGTEEFASRPLDAQTRITLLDGIGQAPRRTDRLTAIVLSGLQDGRAAVRERAIHNLTQLGHDAIGKAAPDLQRMTVDVNEPPEVRAAADKALRVMVGESPFTR